jgi:Secretion system C-terminal sorting domain
MKNPILKTDYASKIRTCRAAFMFTLVLFSSIASQAQVGGCSVSETCLDYEDPGLYTVISQNDPGTFLDLITAGKLLDPNQAQSIPQRLIVCREIIANVPNQWYIFAPGSEIIFATSTSGMKIAAGHNVQIRGTHIHGCAVLWNGIQVENTARLDLVLGTKIEDAVKAVKLIPNSIFTSSLTMFDGNYISIYAGQTNMAPGSLALGAVSIHGNTFSGLKTLLQPYTEGGFTHTRPYIGILAENLAGINIGLPSAGTGVNLFKDFIQGIASGNIPIEGKGIYALNSNVTIVNCRFENIGAYDETFRGEAISGLSSNTGQKITITGLGGTSAATPTFSNVTKCVSAIGMSIIMSDCMGDGCSKGIFVSSPSALSVLRINITHCYLQNICINGIELSNTAPSKSVFIADNTLLFNNPEIACAAERIGIFISNTGSGLNYHLLRNTIRNTVNPSGAAFRGIVVRNVTDVKIEACNISDEGTAGDAIRFNGIKLDHASNAALINNNVIGNTTSYPFIESAGILNKESNSTIMICNAVDMINRGFEFNGMNCDATAFVSNNMSTHTEGLYLWNATRIGQQYEKNNRWFGAGGQIEGKYNFIGYDPTEATDRLEVNLSKFSINTYDETATRWANPRLIGTDTDMDPILGYVWFKGTSENPIETACSITPSGRSASDDAVIAGTFLPFRGLASTVWEARYHTYGRLFDDATLRPSGSDAENWFQANQNTSFAKLYQVAHSFNLIGTAGTGTETIFNDAGSLLVQRDAAEAQWAVSTGNAQDQWKTTLDGANAAVIAAQGSLNTALDQDASAAQTAIQNLYTTLAGIAVSEQHEVDLESVLGIMIAAEISETPFNAAQQQALSAIAEKCRLEGGYAVVLARLALDRPLDASNDIDCTLQERSQRQQTKSADSAILVFPNPSKDVFFVKLPNRAEKTQLSLTDLTGKQLRQWTTKETSFQITDTQDLPNGLYLLTVTPFGTQPKTLKIHLLK